MGAMNEITRATIAASRFEVKGFTEFLLTEDKRTVLGYRVLTEIPEGRRVGESAVVETTIHAGEVLQKGHKTERVRKTQKGYSRIDPICGRMKYNPFHTDPCPQKKLLLKHTKK